MRLLIAIALSSFLAAHAKAEGNYQTVAECRSVLDGVPVKLGFYIAPGTLPAHAREAYAEFEMDLSAAGIPAEDAPPPLRHHLSVHDLPNSTGFEMYVYDEPQTLFARFEMSWLDFPQIEIRALTFGNQVWGVFDCARGDYRPGPPVFDPRQ